MTLFLKIFKLKKEITSKGYMPKKAAKDHLSGRSRPFLLYKGEKIINKRIKKIPQLREKDKKIGEKGHEPLRIFLGALVWKSVTSLT